MSTLSALSPPDTFSGAVRSSHCSTYPQSGYVMNSVTTIE